MFLEQDSHRRVSETVRGHRCPPEMGEGDLEALRSRSCAARSRRTGRDLICPEFLQDIVFYLQWAQHYSFISASKVMICLVTPHWSITFIILTCEICGGQSCKWSQFFPRNFFGSLQLIIILPLLHLFYHCPLRWATALTTQHTIISSVIKLGASFLARNLAGYTVRLCLV